MVRGYDKHQGRLEALAALGRALARRSHSSCELCAATQVRLDPFEVPPLGEEPLLERTLLLCERCRQGVSAVKRIDGAAWRFLETAVWSELAPAQALSLYLVRSLAGRGESWAVDLLDQVYVAPEVAAWSEAIG